MLRYNVTRIVEVIFLGPFAVVIVLVVLAILTPALMFLFPAAVIAIFSAIAFVVIFLFDFLIHPSLIKLWAIICFFAASVLLYAQMNRSASSLPIPEVRRGRTIDAEPKAKQRAVNAIKRRREALRTHRFR